MTGQAIRSENELSRGDICPNCGGSLAAFPEPGRLGSVEELKCLMCAKSYQDGSAPAGYGAPGEETNSSRPKIKITRPASRLLKGLLASKKASPGAAFRLEKQVSGVSIEIGKKKPGDLVFPSEKNPLIILSMAAARDIDGSTITLVEADGEERITVKHPGSESPAKKSA